MNALAATAGAFALGIPVRTAARALATVTPVQGRQVVHKLPSGATLIDDTYNANPASVTAAMDSLATRAGHRILVLGQLAELGEQSEAAHREIGQWIGKSAIDSFLATGERMQVAVETCNAIDRKGQWFANKAQLIENLRAQLGATSCVLVKGSRSSAMEEVVHALLPHRQTQGGH
jgi:UDP-N-acetylmuramoyl-tripeptide--D-alanyl-D-alanine ligase